MRIDGILQRQLGTDLTGIHLARQRAVFAAARAVIRGGEATLTSIGRAIAQGTSHKHGIKRVDRLLGNKNLWLERPQFFRAIAHRVISAGTRPTIVIDWTGTSSEFWSLVAAVNFDGRAIVIYAETHPVARYNKPAVNAHFLRRLREILPECVPTIVTDAGFRTPWMRAVAYLGWGYICRTRGLNVLRQKGGKWCSPIKLAADVSDRPKDFGECEISMRTRHKARVVAVRKRRADKTRRRVKCRTHWGMLPRTPANKHRRSAREPWVLATSSTSPSKRIVKLYGFRMQIEQTFRDAKCDRFGLSLGNARTTSKNRADILMLLASLALLLSTIVGLVAEAYKLGRGYQANTTRKRRVFSIARLGQLLLKDPSFLNLRQKVVNAAWSLLLERTRLHCEPL